MQGYSDYNNIPESMGQIQNVPAGGYVCDIKKVIVENNKNSTGQHLSVWFDISEGDCRGWFEQDYKAQYAPSGQKVWHGVYYQNLPNRNSNKYNQQVGFFKHFINTVNRSNGCNIDPSKDWNENELIGKKIGLIFSERERQSSRGTRYMTTIPQTLANIDDIRSGNYKVPEPKYLNADAGNDFTRAANGAVNVNANGFSEPSDVNADLPF